MGTSIAQPVAVRYLPALAATWVLTRATLFTLLLTLKSPVQGDAAYYRASMAAWGHVGIGHTLPEYPLPAFAALLVVWWGWQLLAGALPFVAVLGLLALGTDALFAGILHRCSRGSWTPLLVWILAVPMLGPLCYARFDLLPGVLLGLALLVLATRPGVALAAATLATSIKLWPVIVLPTLVAGTSRRRYATVVTVVTGAAVSGLGAALAGWDRLFSPLGYQSERGLQIESPLAWPAMVLWRLDPDGSRVVLAASRSFEVHGPVVSTLLLLSTLATVALLGGLSLVWIRLLSRPVLRPAALVWTVLAAVTGFMVVGKVLSPQYFLWILPAACAGLALLRTDRTPLLRWSLVLLAATGLTQAVFPFLYDSLIAPGALTWAALLVLGLRNALLVWLFVIAARHAWREWRAAPADGSGDSPRSARPSMDAAA